jgi:hypothetical protein
VDWQDNHFSLLQAERRDIDSTYDTPEAGSARPVLEAKGWNARLSGANDEL